MATEPMPPALRNTTRSFISEIADSLGEVLHFGYPERAHDWRRMTGYRITDASDTAGLLADVYAAHHTEDGMERHTLEGYLQTEQQVSRSAMPSRWGTAALADITGEPRPAGTEAELVLTGHEDPGDDPRNMQTEAALMALRAVRSEDNRVLDHLDEETRAMALRVVQALQRVAVPA